MSKKGGYKIIDLADISLSDVAVSLPGIHSAIEGNLGKAILLSGLNFEGIEKADCYTSFYVTSGSFIGEIYDKKITITADDEITIAPKGGGGTEYTEGNGIDITDYVISVDTDIVQEKLTAGTNITIVDNVISATGGSGAVESVNGQTGVVVLTADDIDADNTQSVQENLERIDAAIEDVIDDLDTKLDATKAAVATVGGLVIPTSTPTDTAIVAVGTDNSQEQIYVGDNLTLDGTTSPYTLKVTGFETWTFTLDDDTEVTKSVLIQEV